jgi:hypothetical protein
MGMNPDLLHRYVRKVLSIADDHKDREIDDATKREMELLLHNLKRAVRDLMYLRERELVLCRLELDLLDEFAPGTHLKLVAPVDESCRARGDGVSENNVATNKAVNEVPIFPR